MLPYNDRYSILIVRRLGDRHSRCSGKHNGDVLEPDVCARVLEHQPGRAGREIRRHVQTNRRKVRSSNIMNRARKNSDFYLVLHITNGIRIEKPISRSVIQFFWNKWKKFSIKHLAVITSFIMSRFLIYNIIMSRLTIILRIFFFENENCEFK